MLTSQDNGMYAQIAIPFVLGLLYLSVSLFTMFQVYIVNKKELNAIVKGVFGILLLIPIVLAFVKFIQFLA